MMGKKKHRSGYTSKGQRRNVSKENCKMVKNNVSAADKALNIIEAWRAGKNPWISIVDINRAQGRQHTRVRANDCYGNPKFLSLRQGKS